VETAEIKKEEGNGLFKSGSYADALSLYVFFFYKDKRVLCVLATSVRIRLPWLMRFGCLLYSFFVWRGRSFKVAMCMYVCMYVCIVCIVCM